MANKNNFEEIIKAKIDNLELPYNNNDWLQFETKLPKTPKTGFSISVITKIVAAISLSTIIIALVLLDFNETKISSNSDDTSKIINEEIKAENTIIAETIIDKAKTESIEISNTNINNNKTNSPTTSEKEIKQEIATKKKEIKTNNTEQQQQSKNETILEDSKAEKDYTLNGEFTVNQVVCCTNSDIKFTIINSTKINSYLWNFGDGTTSELQNPAHKYQEEGSYKVVLVVSSGDKSTEWAYPENIIVNPTPNANFSTNRVQNKYSFTSISSSYLNNKWFIENDEFINIGQIEYDFNKSGRYKVIHICDDANGCVDTISQILDFIVEHKVLVPNAFSPDGDGHNDFFGPNNDCSKYQYKMMIFNKMGNLVFETNSSYNKWDGNVAGFNKPAETGVYIYKIITTDEYNNSQTLKGTIALYRNY